MIWKGAHTKQQSKKNHLFYTFSNSLDPTTWCYVPIIHSLLILKLYCGWMYYAFIIY